MPTRYLVVLAMCDVSVVSVSVRLRCLDLLCYMQSQGFLFVRRVIML